MATIETTEVIQTRLVSGRSKSIVRRLRYLAVVITLFTSYEAAEASTMIARMKKIQHSSCTCTSGSCTASTMNVTRATPVTP